jgi:hypothetical protein
LEEAILGSDYALGEEEIVLVLGVNVGNSRAIAENVDGAIESLHVKATGYDSQSLMRCTNEIRLLSGLSANAERKQEDDQADGFHGRPIVMLLGNAARPRQFGGRARTPALHRPTAPWNIGPMNQTNELN